MGPALKGIGTVEADAVVVMVAVVLVVAMAVDFLAAIKMSSG